MTQCIIIDDERPARELLEFHLMKLSDIKVVASFGNAIDGFNYLQLHQIDLVFLDIQMPQLSGMELIKSLHTCPAIILTTAFREYAVEAYEAGVIDYLVKPITQERCMKAISRFFKQADKRVELPQASGIYEEAYIFIKTGKQHTKVYLRDILYIEGLKDYVKLHTREKKIIASERLSYMEERLPENKFIRIHKSYIIALDKLSGYTFDKIQLDSVYLPLGRMYKNEFLKRVKLV